MLVIPVIEIREGDSIQPGTLRDPVSTARALADVGFSRVHVIDVDAANGTGSNAAAVENVVRDGALDVQVDGGINSVDQIERVVDAGASRVVLGPRALSEADWLVSSAELFPDALVVATHVHERRLRMRGWTRSLPTDLLDLAAELAGLPLGGLLVSAPADGARTNTELALLEDAVEACGVPVIAAGGVQSMHDLRALEHRGVAAVLLGAALHSGLLDGRSLAREFAD